MDKKKYPPDWGSRIRPAVLKRDRYTCQRCGARGGQLKHSFVGNKSYVVLLSVAHLNHDRENQKIKLSALTTLCQSCHINYDIKTDTLRGEKISKGIAEARRKKKLGFKNKIVKAYYFGETKTDPRYLKE